MMVTNLLMFFFKLKYEHYNASKQSASLTDNYQYNAFSHSEVT